MGRGEPFEDPCPDYTGMIARDWNVKYNDGHRGYVAKFDVRADVANSYDHKIAGGRECEELWAPAKELNAFTAAIVSKIEGVAEFS